ncbi:glycosyl transferase family 1 [Gemmatimonadetes bacterium T265]|nr:glycosyl transferase family 1 [Gemmatimonadetes bacterium T265]
MIVSHGEELCVPAPGWSVAVVHNRYLQPGGEDAAVAVDVALLEARGHPVARYDVDNRAIAAMTAAAAARAAVWNPDVRHDLGALLARERPAVAHFHNTFPLVSPAAYAAARDAGVAVVQSLHNYRLLCPNAVLFRDGRVCEDCLTRRVKWPGVAHACYRDSRPASAATAGMLAVHWTAGTYERAVDVYVAHTEFARRKFVEGGLPADRIMVRPSFVGDDPGAGRHDAGYALFVGRLSPEKGLGTLLGAWHRLAEPRPLKIVGSGPLESTLDRTVPGVEFLGARPRADVLALMRDAAFLVFPSECYENFPMALAEAFATGLPVVAAGHGAAAEIIEHGRTGRHFVPGDVDALARAAEWAFDHPCERLNMGAAARREFEARYTADHAYARLMDIYERATARAAERR